MSDSDATRSAPAPGAIVHDTLREYAERGVFRGFDAASLPGPDAGEGGDGGPVFSFRFFWLGPRPFRIDLSPDGDTLAVRDPLPALARHPAVRAEVERMIEERLAPTTEGFLPPHRRIDGEKVSAKLVPSSGPRGEDSFDLVLTIRDAHQEYAVRKVLNLIHEIWVRLQDRHQRYLWEELQAPME
ncbi:MAG: hypothetical protein ACOC8K_09500 [Gemmatimonadota bacterium]